MHCFSIPVGFFHHDIFNPSAGTLNVSCPRFNIKKHYALNLYPKNTLPNTQTILEFNTNGTSVPYTLDFDFQSDNNYLQCVIFKPTVGVSVSGLEKINNATLQTMNLKLNSIEQTKTIPNLLEKYNFKSWANIWMKPGDQLQFRFFVDLYFSVHQNLNLDFL